jgi:anthranilate phosphoribosyltransferase
MKKLLRFRVQKITGIFGGLNMVFSAYVLGVSQIGKEKEVLEKCLKVRDVVEGTVVFGEYDVIVKIVTNDMKDLSKRVEEIRNIEGLLRTTTLISMP